MTGTNDAFATMAQFTSRLPVTQVGILVRDLESAAQAFGRLFNVGPWSVYTYGPGFVPQLDYRGAPASFSMRLALAGNEPQIELIEPLEGPSIYHEWLEEHGEGLHHLGARVDSIEDGIRNATECGIAVIQSGRGYGVNGDGGFAYLDTVASPLGLIFELIEVPTVRHAPEAIWTPQEER